jgi:uncharacterized repeat protein (TIGR03843 family)
MTLGTETALELLGRGAIEVKGRLPRSSNATFLAEIVLGDVGALAVYKPERGERPLWDFPRGLYRREIAAYRLSEALGWGLVPPTVAREGPFGAGSLQLFVEADFRHHYFTLVEEPRHHDALRRICLFDLIANNTDRKGGHCLLRPDGRIYAVDNALTFHVDPKLRTVIWAFGGEPIPAEALADVERVSDAGLPEDLDALLTSAERQAVRRRARGLLRAPRFPVDDGSGRYPWPLV